MRDSQEHREYQQLQMVLQVQILPEDHTAYRLIIDIQHFNKLITN